MHWCLVLTKPRQEKLAFDNIVQQGYECYLPTIPTEKLFKGSVVMSEEPLFPRYLFVRLGQGPLAKSWAPLRSTKGISRLVTFGVKPALVDDCLIKQLRVQEVHARATPNRLFRSGERVRLVRAPFAGVEGVFQMVDGEGRVMVLIELLSKLVNIKVELSNLRKVG